MWDYLNIIASHFIPALEEITPIIHHVVKLTLAHLQARKYYKCELVFDNEIAQPSAITPMGGKEQQIYDEWNDSEEVPFKSLFPRFLPQM
jgi:hypothetical protein